jgi:hypothetical protein
MAGDEQQPQPAKRLELDPLVVVLREALEVTHLVMPTGQGNPGARLIAAGILAAGILISSAIDDVAGELDKPLSGIRDMCADISESLDKLRTREH